MNENGYIWPGWKTCELLERDRNVAVYRIERTLPGFTENAALKVICFPLQQKEEEFRQLGYSESDISNYSKECLKEIIQVYKTMSRFRDCQNIRIIDDVQVVEYEDGVGWDVLVKMELLKPLLQSQKAAMSEQATVNVGVDICNAIMQYERLGAAHGNITRDNIFVSDRGTYKLGDPKISSREDATFSAYTARTNKYMSPEEYSNQRGDTQSDIYSLGLVLYELLNDNLEPFLTKNTMRNGDVEQARIKRLTGMPLPSPKHGNPSLKHIILKACSYEKELRYQSVEEFRDALLKVKTTSDHSGGKKKFLWVAGCCVTVLVSVFGLIVLCGKDKDEPVSPTMQVQNEAFPDLQITNTESSARLGEPIQITIETSTNDNGLEITYHVNDETIASITESGILTGLRPGTVVVEASDGESSDSFELQFAIPANFAAEDLNDTERAYICSTIDDAVANVDSSEDLYEKYEAGYIDTNIGEIYFYQDQALKKMLYSMTYQVSSDAEAEEAERKGLLSWYGDFYLGHTVIEMYYDSNTREVYFLRVSDKYYERSYACYYYNGKLFDIKDEITGKEYKSEADQFLIEGWTWWGDSEIYSEYGSFKFTGWADFQSSIYQFAMNCCNHAQEEYAYISTYQDPNFLDG